MGSNAGIVFMGKYTIRTQEIDMHKQLTVPSLIRLMQEASMQNVIDLKASVWDLEDQSLSWVLLRKELTILDLPKLGQTISVQTYPAGFKRVFAYRDYKAFDESGRMFAYAGSSWTLMNTNTRKMERIPDEMFKFTVPQNMELLPVPEPKISKLEKTDFEKKFNVNWYDLDWNGHVNNGYIVKCLLESMPDLLIRKINLRQLKIHFKNESLWKDELHISFEHRSEKVGLARVINNSRGVEVASAEMIWT